MLDTKRLLDQLLGGQAGRGSGERGFDPSQIGDLAKQLGGRSLGGGGSASKRGGLGDALGNLTNEQLLGAGGLAAILLGSKGGRGMGGSALKLGGLAAIGAMAYRAYQDWQAGQTARGSAQAGVSPSAPSADQPSLPAPVGTPFRPGSEAEEQSLARSLLRAMIAAAKADGRVDATEQASIFAEMDKLDIDAEDKAFVIDELRAPLDLESIARSARTPEESSQIYTASLLAIDVDEPAERGYLTMLAARLKLDDKLVEHLHATVKANTQAVKA